jgi:FkbM family methyltransferase
MSPHPDWRDRLLASWWRRHWRGFLSLRRLLGRTNGVRGVTPYGSTFLLDPLSYIDGIVLTDGFYESEVLDALRAATSTGTVVWDIGANFGLHAMTLARLVPGATIVAFEPNPSEHARLLRHRAWNAPAALTSSVALSSSNGMLPLHLGPAGNSGMTTLSPWSQGGYSGTVLVATARGDDLVAAGVVPAPQVIKLDVEGHEAEVLRGLSAVLRRPECSLVVFEDALGATTEPKRLLEAAGFQLSSLERREPTAHPLGNFVARKRTRS